MNLDLNLIRRGLKKILIAQSGAESRATADMLLAYMDSIDGKMVDTEPEVVVAHDEVNLTYTVKYISEPPNKVEVIKDIRGAVGFGLKEAKDFVEGAPFRKATQKQAEALKGIAIKHNIPSSALPNDALDF